MQKLKPLRPSLREKKRYVVFEALPKKRLSVAHIAKTINLSILQYIGTKGSARAGAIVLNEKYNQNTQRGIIKVAHDSVDDLKAALTLNEDITFQVLGVSGILKKAEKKFIAG